MVVFGDCVTASKYLSVEDGTPTTDTALYGNVTFQTTPTHCFFWDTAKPEEALLIDVVQAHPVWVKRVLAQYAPKAATTDGFEELERNTHAVRKAREKKQKEAEEKKQEKLRLKALSKAEAERERLAKKFEKQRLRAERIQKREEKRILRAGVTECSRCHGPIKEGENRYRAVLGFHCKWCGPFFTSVTDAVEGKDAQGRNKYRFGYRRKDGIWVCPPAYARGSLSVSMVNSQSHYRKTPDGCYRTPLHVYGDRLGGGGYSKAPWWVNIGTAAAGGGV
jgi:hypothetical protein